jgi:hypothetical protein
MILLPLHIRGKCRGKEGYKRTLIDLVQAASSFHQPDEEVSSDEELNDTGSSERVSLFFLEKEDVPSGGAVRLYLSSARTPQYQAS